MAILFFDTETTGLPVADMHYHWEGQPRIVQLAAILTDDKGDSIAALNLLIRPDGWTIPDKATAIHGISQERAEKFGVPIRHALGVFVGLHQCADIMVAHNLDFDNKMIHIESCRLPTSMKPTNCPMKYCTMEKSAPILAIPPTARMEAAGHLGFKSPSLAEAYRFFFGCGAPGAHDAMLDAMACRDIYFAIQERPLAMDPGSLSRHRIHQNRAERNVAISRIDDLLPGVDRAENVPAE